MRVGLLGKLAAMERIARVQEGRGPQPAAGQDVANFLMGSAVAAVWCGCVPEPCC